jgi:hypothetical protein
MNHFAFLAFLSFAFSASPAFALNDLERGALGALARMASVKVPKQGLHCEVGGPGDMRGKEIKYKPVTVGAIFADYAAWALSWGDTHVQSFSCKGTKPLTCEWVYGQKESPKSPAWSLLIKYQYDPEKQAVIPQSLNCIQVP